MKMIPDKSYSTYYRPGTIMCIYLILTVPNEETKTEKLNNLPKVIRYLNSGVRIPTQAFWLWSLSS